MAAVRNRFGNELVLAAVPGGPSFIAAGGYENVSQYVDWFTVMAFDFVGSWTPFGPTAPHSALSDYAGTPIPGLNAQSTVSTYRNMGIPAEKLVLGVTFYGVGWTGVTQTAPGGSATGLADGSHGSGLEAYRVLAVTCPPTGTVGGTAYAKCGPNWWTYDTPTTLAAKARWAKSQGLGGTAFWELSMDTADGQLVRALHANRQATIESRQGEVSSVSGGGVPSTSTITRPVGRRPAFRPSRAMRIVPLGLCEPPTRAVVVEGSPA